MSDWEDAVEIVRLLRKVGASIEADYGYACQITWVTSEGEVVEIKHTPLEWRAEFSHKHKRAPYRRTSVGRYPD